MNVRAAQNKSASQKFLRRRRTCRSTLVSLVNLRNEAHTHRLGHCGSQLRVADAVDAAAPVAASAVTAASHATIAFPAASKATTADATTAVATA